jgi:multiple sugar transport system permease protein
MFTRGAIMVGDKGIKKYLVIAGFLLPNLLGIIIFMGIPIMSSLLLSFTEWDLIGNPKFRGLNNYLDIFKSKDFWSAFRNTCYYILGYLPLVLIISLMIALLLNRKIKGIVMFRAIYFLPVITSWVAVSMIWKWLFNPEYGLINHVLSMIGIAGPAWLHDPKWAMPAIILTSVWKDIGFIMVIFLAGLQGISEDYYEAADIDGANGWHKFRSITLPMLAPTTFFILIISIINSFQVFPQVWIMTEGGPAGSTSVIVEQIYKNAFRYFKMGYASALSWVLFAVIFVFTLIQNRLQKRWVGYD